MNAIAQGKIVDNTDTIDHVQREIIDSWTKEQQQDGGPLFNLSLLLSHSPKPFIRVTFMLICDVGSLLISQKSIESAPILAPVWSGAQPNIEL